MPDPYLLIPGYLGGELPSKPVLFIFFNMFIPKISSSDFCTLYFGVLFILGRFNYFASYLESN